MKGIPGRFAAFVLFIALVPAAVEAQSAPPRVQVQADQDTVGVGDILHVEMTVQSGQAMPMSPDIGQTPGFVVRAQSTSPSQTHISINGNRTDRWGVTVDWTLQAQRVGNYSLGPPTIVVDGVRYASHPVSVRVVPAGQALPRQPQQPQQPQAPQSPFGFSPFDPWKGLFGGLTQDDQQTPPPQAVTTDPKLSLDAARGAYYFLHATVDKNTAVVGEQVIFSVYEYVDASTNVEIDGEALHDATAADFLKHPLVREDQDAILAGYASIEGRIWVVKLVRRWALFPLRAGDLTIGPMSLTLLRPRNLQGSKRASETFHVHVSEPPSAGRPPGYALGDVGHFTLQAQVTPREVAQDGAVGVHVEVSGTGNIPSSVAAPIREGVEWLTPEVHEQLGPIGHDAFGGKRTFDFVVRTHRPGDVDLGDIVLAFWDPEAKRYDVARAPLGKVRVSPSATQTAASADAPEGILPGLPGPHDALEGRAVPTSYVDDALVFWLGGVAGWPLALGAAVGGRAAGRRVRRAWRERKVSRAAELKERSACAASACAASDARAADAAIARALQSATAAHVGVNVRGAVGDEVVRRLEHAGVASPAAAAIAELLRECENARFSPETADILAARDRWVRAQGAIRGLEKR